MIRKEKRALEMLRAHAASDGTVSTTVINVCELYAGAYGSKDPGRELERVNEILSTMRILNLDDAASQKYGELANSHTLKKNPIGDFDLLIACIAIVSGESIVTLNKSHFSRVPNLSLENW